ncbi:carboxypeptidase regulatory-like domain-containing protein [Nakamurella sp. GG22]
MRVSAGSTLVDLAPGSSTAVDLDIINTGQVIDGVTARVIGLPEQQVSTQPPVLALFPEATGRLTVNMGVPAAFPAGRHPVTVEVRSRQDGTAPEYLDLDLIVPTLPGFGLMVRPKVVRAHRTARFVVIVANSGNTPLEIGLAASDPEKIIASTVTPERVLLEPGHSCEVLVEVRGPRMIMGSEIDRPVTLTATALTADPTATETATATGTATETATAAPTLAPSARVELVEAPPDLRELLGEGAEDDGPDPQTAILMLRQRPWITRGMLTALILLAIIALWAAVFLFGLREVFTADPPTKTAPASFFVGDIVLVASTGGSEVPAPAGALAKDGTMPSGLGGVIAGTVTAKSSEEPVGRILVDALRQAPDGSVQVAGSTATQADGSYQVAGLFPDGYLLRFTACREASGPDCREEGFEPVFYPGVPDQAAGTQVTAKSAVVTRGIDVVITGKPASITGSVDLGDTLQPVETTVTARATQGAAAGKDIATTVTDGANAYTLEELPAPGVYELSFAAEGYLPTIVQTTVDGGSRRIQPTVLLSASPGQIAGTVTGGGAPLGGATVTTTVDGQPVSTGTPTTGNVGRFVLGELPTPATYVLTVAAPGFGETTVVVDLGPGQRRDDLAVDLASGTGQLTGVLVDAAGAGVGGATVAVGGMTDPPTTTTLTTGTVGAFEFSGLPAGAALTVTFDRPGFAPTTVPVQLGAVSAPLTVTMSDSLGRIGGNVSGPGGAPLAGATVTATDGQKSWPVTTSSAGPGGAAGTYLIAGLPVGMYTVTASSPATEARTTLVTVAAGGRADANFALPEAVGVTGGG